MIPASAPPSSVRSRRTCVLVVDDEELVRQYLTRSLEVGGYEVLLAESGAAALGVLERAGGRIGLIICDFIMPGMNGRQFGKRVAERWPDCPILFISGYPRDVLAEQGLYDPTIHFLKKPFLPARLLESVEDAIGSHA
jgi:two-component system, cell cycle sensor histidine kinase and response regulator CckA